MKLRHLTRHRAGQPLKDQALEGRQFGSRAMTAFLGILAVVWILVARYAGRQFKIRTSEGAK